MLTERTLPGLHDALFSETPSLPSDAIILDLGCGSGAWLARHAGPERTLVGVDLDSALFALQNAQIIVCNLDREDIPVEKGRFDLVTAIEVIEHLENPGRLVMNAARALKPGGWFLLSTPNVHSVAARLKHLAQARIRQFDGQGDLTHITPIALPFIEAVWPRHGFTIERIWGYPRTGTLLARRWVALGLEIATRLFPPGIPGDALCVLARRNG